jgi:hypothetical protein|tara:strand:+ start:3145 stop:3375 length:231 start_codon:yes stop_codon:yes gene_type:complete
MKEDHKMKNSWEAMSKARTAKYQAYKKDVMPIIKEIQASGVKTLQGIADGLTDRKVKTAFGKGKWHPSQVKNLLER